MFATACFLLVRFAHVSVRYGLRPSLTTTARGDPRDPLLSPHPSLHLRCASAPLRARRSDAPRAKGLPPLSKPCLGARVSSGSLRSHLRALPLRTRRELDGPRFEVCSARCGLVARSPSKRPDERGTTDRKRANARIRGFQGGNPLGPRSVRAPSRSEAAGEAQGRREEGVAGISPRGRSERSERRRERSERRRERSEQRNPCFTCCACLRYHLGARGTRTVPFRSERERRGTRVWSVVRRSECRTRRW